MLNLNQLRPRLRNKTVEVLLLANNFHSITGGSIEEYNLVYLVDALRKKWDKINHKLKENGWEEIDITGITYENAEIVAYKLLNKCDKERYR